MGHSTKTISLPIVLAAISFAITAQAQQSIFNVPTGDVGGPSSVLVQNEVDLTDEASNQTTFDYGLGKKWQAGLNLLNLPLGELKPGDENAPQSLPSVLLINLEKSFELKPDLLSMGMGTQQGLATGSQYRAGRYATFSWGLLQLNLEKLASMELVVGGYAANQNLAGDGDKFAPMAGMDFEIFKALHFSGEWMGGNNQMGASTLGLTAFFIPKVPIAVGYRIPNNPKMSRPGVSLQITVLPL